jgi:hypothetical protein
MVMSSALTTQASDAAKIALDRRFERIGWALFLIMIGGLALVPDRWIPEGSWLVGTGLIMLGLNAVRYASGIRMSTFTIVLGFIALSSGLSDVAGVDLPVIPIVLIAIGAHIISKVTAESKNVAPPN